MGNHRKLRTTTTAESLVRVSRSSARPLNHTEDLTFAFADTASGLVSVVVQYLQASSFKVDTLETTYLTVLINDFPDEHPLHPLP